jgi:hypothetical protein
MNFIEYILNLFKKEELEKLGEITNDNLKKLFKKEGVIQLDPIQIYALDNKYNLTNKENIQNFLKKDWGDLKSTDGEKWDCEDFALQLWANFKKKNPTFALGFAISGGHAFNITITWDKQIWVIEPQTDKIMSYPQKDKYSIKMIII